MNRSFPRFTGASWWLPGGAATLGVVVLCAHLLPSHNTPRPKTEAHDRIPVIAAKYQAPPTDTPPIVIEADATQPGQDDPNALKTVQEALLRLDPKTPPATPMPTGADTPDPNWVLWARLRTAPTPVTVPPDAGVTALAVHSAQGMTLCLINRTTEKKSLQLQIRLPRGVYKGEHLTFSPPTLVAQANPALRNQPDERRLHTIAYTAQAADTAPTASAVVLERLQGRVLNASAVVRKPCLLLPGQVAFYRYTDVAQGARAALNETYDALHTMALKTPGPARRLRHILEEGNGSRGSLSPGNGKSTSARLEGIHHLLLYTAQVQSMQRNYQERHTVNAVEGAAVMGALDRLTDSLAETSAALLELVPQITVQEEDAPETAQASTVADAMPAHMLLVTVTLANLGRQSPGMVKLGLDTAALPSGVVCRPDDPAYFGALHPGQSVRAVFHVRCPAGISLPTDQCGGDVSYFVSGTPAHLRVRAW